MAELIGRDRGALSLEPVPLALLSSRQTLPFRDPLRRPLLLCPQRAGALGDVAKRAAAALALEVGLDFGPHLSGEQRVARWRALVDVGDIYRDIGEADEGEDATLFPLCTTLLGRQRLRFAPPSCPVLFRLRLPPGGLCVAATITSPLPAALLTALLVRERANSVVAASRGNFSRTAQRNKRYELRQTEPRLS